jgi:hypothetical protein
MKSGKGVDLRRFGKVKIERSSLIEWEEEHQGWTIKLLRCAAFLHYWVDMVKHSYSPYVVDYHLLKLANLTPPDGLIRRFEGPPPITIPLIFKEYEDAVECEINLIQSLRKKYGGKCVL